jgi:hypothetical protein
MLDKGTAEIAWTVKGGLSVFPSVAVDVVSTFKLNLLTGRVTEHAETWACAPGTSSPVAAAVAASRAAWAAREASLDASDGIGRAADSLSSLASMDDDGASSFTPDPNDPMRFFQGGQQDNGMNDALTLATAAAVLWAVYKGFEAVETLR